MNDHMQQVLSVEDIESNSITPENLATWRDSPLCHVHSPQVCELCCKSCFNVPVCSVCMFSQHKGHDVYEVTELARVKRQMLNEQLEVLGKIKEDRNLMPPSKVKEMLIQNVTSEKEKMQKMYEDEFHKEQVELENTKQSLEEIRDWKKYEKHRVFNSLQSEMEKEIQEVKNKYKEMFNQKENEINEESCARENFLEKKLAKSSQKLEQLDKDRKELLKCIQMAMNEKVKTIEAIHFENENEKIENFDMMAYNILASKNDWTAVQCIPELCAAAADLIKDLKSEFSELKTLTNVKIGHQQPFNRKRNVSKILRKVKEKITIDHRFFFINGATSSNDGNIVLTGSPKTGKRAFIIVIDVNGKIIKQQELTAGNDIPWHVCDFISNHKVVLAYEPNAIGVYNVCDGLYFGKVIGGSISSWPVRRKVRCVTTDPVNNHILVGAEYSRDVYVFDDQLNYLYILTLPEIIKWPQDFTVSDGHLLVCDYSGGKSYVTTMKGLDINVVREFIKPDVGADELRPWSVCTDKDGFVYMLWKCQFQACYCAHYIHDGSQVLSTRKVNKNATVVTAVETAQGEKLIVATHSKHKVYSYDLIEEDEDLLKDNDS